jgi:hypothetical protein
MSLATLETPRITRKPLTKSAKPANAEDMLREMAFVLEMTRRAKELDGSIRPTPSVVRR